MRYISTRGAAPSLDFSSVLLAGLAEDGGLYLPQTWPAFTAEQWREMRSLSYPALAARVMAPFTAGCLDENTLLDLCSRAYARFDHNAIAPLVQLEAGLFVQELFHGPTLAFKDMAMQLLGLLFEHVLEQKKQTITIVGATSGDTGSAAIEAFRDRERVHIVILHPEGRTSEVQRRQMTTVLAENVTNIAVKGTFDDCQDLVKGMFSDARFRKEMNLSAVNSINWARIAAQVPYYVYSALALGAPDRPVSFAVPTGNFGNILAAWVARRMGLPVETLCVGSNHNDILTRFLADNDMSIRGVKPSLSPSMDIQVSSNFERLLFESLNRDAQQCSSIMRAFRKTKTMGVPEDVWKEITTLFHGMTLSDKETQEEISHLYKNCHYLADPHTIIGIAAGKRFRKPDVPMIAIATAHPAKFPDAIKEATGVNPELPPHLEGLYTRPERLIGVSNDLAAVEAATKSAVLKNST